MDPRVRQGMQNLANAFALLEGTLSIFSAQSTSHHAACALAHETNTCEAKTLRMHIPSIIRVVWPYHYRLIMDQPRARAHAGSTPCSCCSHTVTQVASVPPSRGVEPDNQGSVTLGCEVLSRGGHSATTTGAGGWSLTTRVVSH